MYKERIRPIIMVAICMWVATSVCTLAADQKKSSWEERCRNINPNICKFLDPHLREQCASKAAFRQKGREPSDDLELAFWETCDIVSKCCEKSEAFHKENNSEHK